MDQLMRSQREITGNWARGHSGDPEDVNETKLKGNVLSCLVGKISSLDNILAVL